MFCILILTSASTPLILGKSRVRKRARTDLCGGRSAMVVPTATVTFGSELSCWTKSRKPPKCPGCSSRDVHEATDEERILLLSLHRAGAPGPHGDGLRRKKRAALLQ